MRDLELINTRKEYMSIINFAKSQKRNRKDGNYYEAHHILPRSLFPQYSKIKSNIVLLTAKEHFRCHQLLVKIFPGKEMDYALIAFSTRPNADYGITADEYEKLKKMFSKLQKEKMTGKKKDFESIVLSAAKRRKSQFRVRDSYKGDNQKSKTPGFEEAVQKKWLELQEEKRKIESGELVKKWWTDGFHDRFSYYAPGNNWKEGKHDRKGYKLSEERKKEISNNQKGLHWWTNGEIELHQRENPGEGFYNFRLKRFLKLKNNGKLEKVNNVKNGIKNSRKRVWTNGIIELYQVENPGEGFYNITLKRFLKLNKNCKNIKEKIEHLKKSAEKYAMKKKKENN